MYWLPSLALSSQGDWVSEDSETGTTVSDDNSNQTDPQPQSYPGRLAGTVTFEKFDRLYDITQSRISVDGLPGTTTPDLNGYFSIPVPLRTNEISRSFTLRINRKGFLEQAVNNILGPIAGSVRVDIPPLIPETVTIVGTVENPFTQFPAVVVEAGLEGGITGGTPVEIGRAHV